MIENISYLSDFEEINRGYVAFGRNPKGGKITGKDTECVVLSFDFKLPDENYVLLRVPRENNMYNVDLKNIVPSGDLTSLFEKATLDESNLWHIRLGHINFKTMNKLVKGNLVRGLPSKVFENNHTCVAYKKGKQHRASYPLGKFDGKADEGFLVGYFVNRKAFRVFNSRTKIIQETLHINFLKNKPNVAGSGPKWLFDIDTLTQSMNYQPVVVWNESNHSTCIQENLDAGKVGKETVSTQQYVILSLWSTGSKDPQNIDVDVAFDVKDNETEVYVSPSSSDKPKKHDENIKREAKGKSPHTRIMARMVKEQGFEDPDDPDKVYKVVKALYGLHQAARAWYETLANYILENGFQKGKIDQTLFIKKQKGDILLVQKFGLTDGKSVSTPIDTEKPLLKDLNGKDVDVPIYRYLKGKTHLGLWYPKDSPFNLVAYSDSDYAGASLDRKSTIGGCQFIDDLSSHNTKYTSPSLTQKVFANMKRIGKGFLGIETPLFDTMLVQLQVQDVADVDLEDEDDNAVSATPIPPSPTQEPSPPPKGHIPSSPQAQPAPPSSPPPQQPT
uniref:Uncharacterized protein n=1 Tax=Tanacetum cinerariifolium TaxID=118510 RepID=A0A6L2M126_TANCI|nr:hypothetical protein [Tanacetum cinerariifolium]